MTKTGNTHARRLPVEAAWHPRRPGPGLHDHATPARQRAERGNRLLCT
ncbi:hypothetical protein DMH25_30585 [Streptomyces sp. WAC 01325]|nr:hypothetical protein DMH25_30585 [Streptomyces sp. WAC 01325]